MKTVSQAKLDAFGGSTVKPPEVKGLKGTKQ
jgi:hypothetical protein